jgi:hypothetical protein
MNPPKTFRTNSLFQGITYDENADSWILSFSDKIGIVVSGFWRLLEKSQIALVSTDHDNLFGHSQPVDIPALFTKIISGKYLEQVLIKSTGDLLLTFSSMIEIEIFISSTGYESYNLNIEGQQYIGLGGGEIAVF